MIFSGILELGVAWNRAAGPGQWVAGGGPSDTLLSYCTGSILSGSATPRRDERTEPHAMTDSRRIAIYDTTLRDGTQGEGFSLSMHDKLLVARKLDELGVDYIEGGFPGSNPKDVGFFREVRSLGLTAKVAAFGMTRRR